jgi:hypothetical protein
MSAMALRAQDRGAGGSPVLSGGESGTARISSPARVHDESLQARRARSWRDQRGDDPRARRVGALSVTTARRRSLARCARPRRGGLPRGQRRHAVPSTRSPRRSSPRGVSSCPRRRGGGGHGATAWSREQHASSTSGLVVDVRAAGAPVKERLFCADPLRADRRLRAVQVPIPRAIGGHSWRWRVTC